MEAVKQFLLFFNMGTDICQESQELNDSDLKI